MHGYSRNVKDGPFKLERPSLRQALISFLLTLAVCAAPAASAFDGHSLGRDGLWRVVHDLCLPVSRVIGLPTPCLAVNHDKGFATLRAPDDITHIIVTPLKKVSGIESAGLLEPDAPNYWADAWSQRHWVSKAAQRPLAWNDFGMAINSLAGRSQDQLHIHVDCVDPRLKDKLIRTASGRKGWFDLNLHPWAARYRAKRLPAEDLNRNIFGMVAAETPHSHDRMERETIAVIGFDDPKYGPGFVLVEAGNGGHGEELLDHDCRAVRQAADG
jgi:CDP-diacylglycerol pyrophosphatase